MPDTQASAPNLHPTMCIGLGSYGLKVLQHLLLDSEAHALLQWQNQAQVGRPAVRSLKDLVLIHIRDRGDGLASESQLAKDLFRQIRSVSPQENDVRTALLETKQELLDEAKRNTVPGQFRLGLDVLVLAQPRSLDALGAIERLLYSSMVEMASDVGLRQPAEGAARINFILFLDFDNYWDTSRAGGSFRQDVHKAIKSWEDRKGPSFGRIYLVDGHTGGGTRDEAGRIEELVLFLQCAMLAGMRDDPLLREMYQRESDHTPALGTFGIRVIERSQGLTERLVAAYFGVRWLGQMRGSDASAEAQQSLRVALDEFRPANLDLAEARRELQLRLHEGLSNIGKELSTLDPNREDWPVLLDKQLDTLLISLKADLSAWASARTQQIVDTKLNTVADRLRKAISGALHHDRNPATLGVVIQELKELRQVLKPELAVPTNLQSSGEEELAPIYDIYRRYRDFKLSQVNTARLGEWWWMLAGIAAAAWTPIAIQAVQDLQPMASSAPIWAASAIDLLTWMAKPIIVAPVAVCVVLIAGKLVFQRAIQARVDRGLLVFTHAERGWIISRVRTILQGSGIRVALQAYADEVFENMVRRLRSVILKQIDIALERLQERRKELEWLRNELRNFLIGYGVDPEKPVEDLAKSRGPWSGYRYSLQKMDDFAHLLKMNPATRERFESTQSKLKPFPDWAERYSKYFLYPVTFLERLSQEYKAENVRSPLSAAELNDALGRTDKFTCAFEWTAGAGPGRDVISSYCILPDAWKELGAETLLLGQGFSRQHIIPADDPSRAYLLRLQLRVSAERLEA